jgi:quinol monooxygenase YgiN
MIVVLVEVGLSEPLPEDLKASLMTMEAASRAEEGCVDYAFCQEIGDSMKLRIIEKWTSMEALTEHFAMPHMAAFQEAVVAHTPASLEVKIHELGPELEMPS